jgi:hypothetical protein
VARFSSSNASIYGTSLNTFSISAASKASLNPSSVSALFITSNGSTGSGSSSPFRVYHQ